MYQFKIRINDNEQKTSSRYQEGVFNLVSKIKLLNNIEVEVDSNSIQNSRGVSLVMSSLIIKAIELGVIAGIYTAIKEFYDFYHNAEVHLEFENGSITIKGLTQEEAVKLIEKHLNK